MIKIITFMKAQYKTILLFTLILGSMWSCTLFSQTETEKDKVLISLTRDALKQYHYNPNKFDDKFSNTVFKRYIDALDPTKRFFLKEDIKEFKNYENQIDDQINNEDITFFRVVTDRFLQRNKETKDYYASLLDKPFDFDKNETLSLDYDKKEYPKNKKEQKELWRKQLKLNTLSRLHDKVEDENQKAKDSVNYKKKSVKEVEKKSREEVAKSMDEYYDRMDELNDEDWFAMYLNTITGTFDPHTTYFSPKIKKKFDQEMSGKLEGIGARLQKKGDYTKIVELISGGPAWRQGELEVGDIILKVAQGEKEPLDIVGMRLDDAIEFIKGKKGTEVRLTVKKIDGSTKVIPIIRDVVELEETFAKSGEVDFDGKKYGIIHLPGFYIDFDHTKDYRNSYSDMKKEIEELKKDGVEGLVIDLRNNGGGSLKTAIQIAGLFIKDGPVVQVKYTKSKPRIDKDTDKKIQWNGPLVILVNELSASASEIFSAAMQDYNRAVILGSKQTFGKGTVQNIVPLNRVVSYSKPLGALKMTIQKFYRINGGSTQLKGVSSDIPVPDKYTYMEIGERDEKNPLNWDKIEPADYQPLDFYANFDEVVQKSIERVNKNPQFKLIDENAKWLKKNQEDKLVYLKLDAYKKDIDSHQEASKKFDKIKDYNNGMTFTSPTYELPLLKQDSILAKKREVWHKNLNKDPYVEEALRVLSALKVKKPEVAIKQ
ncbi:MAG TPA: tail-specific protease [Flavobacteriia bacterium]|nr:tail-specific protease [Flavobacteriia bacterium]